ncbi:MAG: adenine deaminase [Desulfarculaceae bacterium]|jgi:adenine deaminase
MTLSKDRLAARISVARGEEPADLLLTGAKVVNLFNAEVFERPIAIHDGVVIGWGEYQAKQTVDLKGGYLVPGFIEGHLHVESTLLSPGELARAVCPHGTSVIVADPHEIANVMGSAGVKAMLEGSANLPVTFYFNAPSCVPATHLETAGAVLEAKELRELERLERVLGLAEVMNFPGVIAGAPPLLDKLLAFADRPIDGHAPLLSGQGLNAYLSAGPESDHECTNLEEAREKLAKGMWLMIRQGTSAHNLADLLPLVTPLTERRCMLVSDDRHPDDLASEGHMDDLLRRAIRQGLDPLIALRLVTLNPARRFGLGRRGAIAPGYIADLVLVEDLKEFKVRQVFQAGRLVARDGQTLAAFPSGLPEAARSTMHLPPLSQETFSIPVQGPKVRIIELIPGQILTKAAIEPPPQQDGRLAADPGRDLALLAVIERHQASGRVGHGLIRGLGIQQGALASSVAHDSHNLVVAGMDAKSLLTAARRVGEMKGGLCAAWGDRVLAELALPWAGLMSDQELKPTLEALSDLRRGAAQLCSAAEPFMSLSFAALPVIPSLRLTDLGLVDVEAFSLVDLFGD